MELYDYIVVPIYMYVTTPVLSVDNNNAFLPVFINYDSNIHVYNVYRPIGADMANVIRTTLLIDPIICLPALRLLMDHDS